MWVLWRESQALRESPSTLLGLTRGSYEAYCLDQAVWYFGSYIDAEVEKAGHKKQKGEAQLMAARKRVLSKYVDGPDAKGQFMDPSVLFEAR